MIRLKRRNTAWLIVMAMIIGLALLAAPVSAAVQLSLIGALAVAVIASMIELGPERETLLQVLNRAPVRRRITPQAREATERAAARAGYFNRSGIVMLDIGLIAMQSGAEGMAMRRTRNISKDDDGARPFITLFVHPEEAERQAVIRYEIYNHLGEEQYVHEMKTYLREGELSLLADHHLPLAGNRGVDGNGDWDLRVYVDNSLIGMHNLMLAPSVNERRRRLSDEREVIDEQPSRRRNLADAVIVEEPQQPQTAQLKDLLKQPSQPSPSRRRSLRRR
ncbi:MAG: hypothetical protein OXG92_10580 [Chloroflexi bacterium]|nr:hypothetical protein [Chloroflexota bacterium]MCY3582992.1 hypothetical protein [Chloroflexota bacterium]MCY3716896.1 hypothetical protein [Chloroflexota bacterium]MDE2650110.1 hypothetical protein [Chloroflexota bacterium]MXX50281.1 hypothetical protein [Chloroflexota bacterium]